MTHILINATTKKAFKQAVADDPTKVMLSDPSVFNPVSGTVEYVVDRVNILTVTNHPKRSWFAQVERKPDGTIKVA